ncbi:MAG: hypothetical protein ACOZF0_16295 [Thermodesulfobacteriota bacterium]
MGCRKLGIVTAIILFIFGGAAWSDEYTGHLDKKGSLAFKYGTQIFPDSDLTDYWDLSPDVAPYPVEISYEHKLGRSLGIELSGCYSQMEDEKELPNRQYDEMEVKNISFSPSIKYHLPVNNSTVLFFGIGPDIVQSRGTLTYTISNRTYEDDVSEIAYGGHGLIGFEYFILKNPAKDNFFDWPLSIGLEYKYTFAEISDYDEELIQKIKTGESRTNPNTVWNSVTPNKLQVGGHTAAITLKWHFF